MQWVLLAALAVFSAAPFQGQDGVTPAIDGLHRPLDEILDVYVRDGFVYYNALRIDRAKLDQYIRSLDGPAAAEQARGSREEQLAFWINAYNAFVLQAVASNFPIRGRSAQYPANSIRQIPGVFERQTFRAAGRSVTLDGIEKDILPPLGDARAFLALGRGAIGGGRLRSEAYDARRLKTQLEAVAAESMTRKEIARVDIASSVLSVSPLFSWREAAFVSSLADKADAIFAQRSPLERAVLGLIEPSLRGAEAELLEKNAFRIVFHDFDWRLNDLSNRPQ